MKTKTKTWAKYLLVLLLLLFVCIYYRSFLADAWKEIKSLRAGQLLCVVLLSVGYQLFEGAVIRLMMKKYVPAYRYAQGVRCAFISSFFRFATLGSGGMAAEIAELSKDGAAPARAAGMSMIQYLIHKVMITVYGICGFAFLLLFTDSNVKEYQGFLWLGTLITGLVAAFLILVCTSGQFARLCFWAVRKAGGRRWEDKLSRLEKQVGILQEEAQSLLRGGRSKATLLELAALDFLKLTCWYLVPAAVLWKKADAAELVALTAAAQMLAGVIPVPAGIGSLEFVFISLSAKVVEEGEAISAMLLLRAAINLIPFLPGLLLSLRKRLNKTETENGL